MNWRCELSGGVNEPIRDLPVRHRAGTSSSGRRGSAEPLNGNTWDLSHGSRQNVPAIKIAHKKLSIKTKQQNITAKASLIICMQNLTSTPPVSFFWGGGGLRIRSIVVFFRL